MMQNAEFLNLNELRRFPFRPTASLMPSSGPTIIKLPDYVLVDLRISVAAAAFTSSGVAAGEERRYFYLHSLVYAGSVLQFFFWDSAGKSAFTATVDIATHTQYKSYFVTMSLGEDQAAYTSIYTDYTDLRGRITVGDLSRLAADLPQGKYVFSQEASPVEDMCVRASAGGVRSITGGRGQPIYGHIRFLGFHGVNFSTSEGNNTIAAVFFPPASSVDAGCECVNPTDPILSVNDVLPDESGALFLSGDEAIDIVATGAHTLKLVHRTAKPCCGCEELKLLQSRLVNQEIAGTRISNFAQELTSQVQVTRFDLTATIARL